MSDLQHNRITELCREMRLGAMLDLYGAIAQNAAKKQREQEPKSPFIFTSERGAPFTRAGFARMVERAGAEAALAFKAHPHILHAPGNTGRLYL